MNPTPTAAQLQEAHAIINRVGVSTEDVVARVAQIIAECEQWRVQCIQYHVNEVIPPTSVPTPKTDAYLLRPFITNTPVVTADFARTLERENAALRAELVRLKEEHHTWVTNNLSAIKLGEEIISLRSGNAVLLEVMKKADSAACDGRYFQSGAYNLVQATLAAHAAQKAGGA